MARTSTAVDLTSVDGEYPFANSEATKMLQEGLERAQQDRGQSQRTLAKLLGYKSSVVLSHMSLGRVPIPVDRALDFARLLGIPAGNFLLAVLQQRHPEIDFTRLLAGAAKRQPRAAGDSFVLEELEALAGTPLDSMPQGIVDVLREVVADRNAPRRWLQLGEVPIVERLRSTHPQGLDPQQRKKLAEFIDAL